MIIQFTKMILLIILLGFIYAIIFLILALIVLCFFMNRRPVVKSDYFKNIPDLMPIEKKYTNKGNYDVSYYEQPINDKSIEKILIWYPSELSMNKNYNRKYPLVIMANGSGINASRYKPIFDHLASWGFIVAGNEDKSSGNGKSSSFTLDYMIELNSNETSQFYNKIDLNNIGIGGHSQGGLGSINCVTAQENGNKFKVIYTASAPSIGISKDLIKAPYNLENLNIPYFQNAGTLKFDAGIDENSGIANLSSMNEKYNSVSENVPKIMARRLNIDHGDMLTHADGYMTAWFMFWLQDDLNAKKAFFGSDAEILSNPNWVDIKKNI